MPAHPIVFLLWDTSASPDNSLPQKAFHFRFNEDPPSLAFGGIRRGEERR